MNPGGTAGRGRWVAGGLALGLLSAWAVTFVQPEMYTSRASLRAIPSSIPERFVPASPALSAATLRTSMLPVIFARVTLTNIIQTYDLFRPERSRMPMEDIVDLMRRQIEIRAAANDVVEIAFSYPDRLLAQRVTRDLMTRLVDETLRQRHQLSMMTVAFLRSQAEKAAAAWDALNLRVRAARPESEGFDRLRLDRELAIRHYESMRTRLVEAETLASLEERQQGASLEVLDIPSLPERPRLSHAMVMAAGGAGGLVLGLLAFWVRRLRTIPPPLLPAALH